MMTQPCKKPNIDAPPRSSPIQDHASLSHPSSERAIRSCGRTDIGLRREVNEDAFALDDLEKIYIVADGVGGGCFGEIASHIAVRAVQDSVAETAGALRHERLEWALHKAHSRLRETMLEDPSLHGMGTTAVGLLLEDHENVVVSHVGDSRAYLLRDAELELLTHDHTLAAEWVAEGCLSRAEARNHPASRILTRALTFNEALDIETCRRQVRPGDLFLLCSDGLTAMLEDEEISTYLEEKGSLEEKSRRLIQAAISRGGHDNVTVVLIEILR